MCLTFCSLLPWAQTCLSLLHRVSVAACELIWPVLTWCTAWAVRYSSGPGRCLAVASLQISAKSWGSRPWLENFIVPLSRKVSQGVTRALLPSMHRSCPLTLVTVMTSSPHMPSLIACGGAGLPSVPVSSCVSDISSSKREATPTKCF